MAFLDKVRDLVPYVKKTSSFEDSDSVVGNPRFLFGSKGGMIEKGWEELKNQAVSLVGNANPGSLAPKVSPVLAINKYRSWVYDCVNIISRKGSVVENYLYREVGEPNDDEFDKIREHNLWKLLNKQANGFMTGRELRQITHMHLDLTGVAFWWIIRNSLGEPAELHPLNPHELVNIEKGDNTNELIKAFHFSPANKPGGPLIIPYEDVVYFHYPHPEDPLIGCSPIHAVIHASDLDMYLQVYEKDFFQNNARPDFLIVAQNDPSPDEIKRFYETWNARHRGPGKQRKPAIISGGVSIEQLSMSASDFEFMALSEWTKDMILACYGIPEAMLGLYESFNKASSITAETTFVKECLEPRLRLMEDCVNMQLLNQFRDSKGLEFKFESALPKDDEFQMAKDSNDLTMGLTTINAVRKRDGKQAFKSKLADVPMIGGQPLPGEDEEADKLWQQNMQPQIAGMEGEMAGMESASQMPAAQGAMGQLGGRPPGGELKTLLNDALRSSRPGLSTLLNAARGKRGGLSGLLGSHPELHTFQELLNAKKNDQTLARMLSKTISEFIKQEYLPEDEWDIFDVDMEYFPKIDAIEKELKIQSEDFFVTKGNEFADIVVKAMDNEEITTKTPIYDIDEDSLKESYRDSAIEYIQKAARFGVSKALKLIEKASDEQVDIEDPLEVSKQAAGRFLERSADLKVKSTKQALTKIIQEGLDEGLDSTKVADNIRSKFKQIGGYRAEMIARTELSGAVSSASDATYRKVNDEAGKIVIKGSASFAVLDERTCKDPDDKKNCRKWHKKMIHNYETGEDYNELPLHPNCRCALVPVMK